MLILSRRRGQAIIIDNDIKVYYLGQSNFGQARIGIEAPLGVNIIRDELLKDANPANRANRANPKT